MVEKIKANINPEILVWAREAMNIDIETAAKKVGVNAYKIKAWESGNDKPTLRQLRLLGKAYRRPTALFYCMEAPETLPKYNDFRKFADVEIEESPELIYGIRRAYRRRETALELAYSLEEKVPQFTLTADVTEAYIEVSKRIRNYLGVSLKEQFSWKNDYEALNNWIRAYELAGILVFQISKVNIEEMRGFSIPENKYPVICVNGKDSPRGKIFTLFHELCHIMLRKGGLCNLEAPIKGRSIESFCNMLAGETLVPAEELLKEDIVMAHGIDEAWEDDELAELANKYKVSNEVIIRRLLILGKTNRKFYNRKRAELMEAYKQKRKEADGFLLHQKRLLRDNGRAFADLVFSAYRHELIDVMDALHHLGDIKYDHLISIENELLK